jgi:hypothetical protein
MFQLIELAICIGCGCSDAHACTNPATGEPCSWLVVDRGLGVGVCSACDRYLEQWRAGRRHLSTLATVKRHKITRDSVL